MTDAQSLIKSECVGAGLKLVDKEGEFDDFIEWKLYQLHKPVHARFLKKQNDNNGVYNRPIRLDYAKG